MFFCGYNQWCKVACQSSPKLNSVGQIHINILPLHKQTADSGSTFEMNDTIYIFVVFVLKHRDQDLCRTLTLKVTLMISVIIDVCVFCVCFIDVSFFT